VALLLRDDPTAKQELSTKLYRDFHALKTYGKEPESLQGIISLFTEVLSGFTPDKINAAFKTHAERSAEFPTPADIVGLIRRNGRPPIKESDVIAIRKKDGQDRTLKEWKMLREWDAEQQEGWRDDDDQVKGEASQQENTRLRQEIITLKGENGRLKELLSKARQEKGIETPVLTVQQKVVATIQAMRLGGANEADVESFASSYGMNAKDVG
jgi:hypothetical protein